MALEDEIDLHPASGPRTTRRMLIFHITGNPGLIEYYRVFLTHLYDILRMQDPKADLHIYGASFPGFEVGVRPPTPITVRKDPPFSLNEQIDSTVVRLSETVKRINNTAHADDGPLPVVLMGHSIGAYTVLEIIARWQTMQMAAESKTAMDIVGGICLFPTVVDIAKSPTGRKATPLLQLPGFALIVHVFAKLLSFFIPLFLLLRIVQLVTFMPYDPAKTTAAFIKSKHGVRQALYLAKHEMQQVTHDNWTDELWGVRPLQAVASAAMTGKGNGNGAKGYAVLPAKPKLYFYWGNDDHWIADTTRDALIKTRGRARGRRRSSLGEEGKPFMEIDRNGVPHGFCIRHSGVIAERVAEYVTEIADSLQT